MTQVFGWIRSRLERLFGHGLQSLKEGFLTCAADQQQGPMLEKQVLETKPGAFAGILPLFSVQRTGSISFVVLIEAVLRTATETFSRELKKVPGSVRFLAGCKAKASVETSLNQARSVAIAESDRTMKGFDEEHLLAFIKVDRNGFRQKLLEELGKQSAQVFTAAIKKHLAELVLRIRQEASEDGPSDPTASGADSLALPSGTRFAVRKGKMTIFVIEQPPQKRTIKVMESGGERSEMVQLALPYVVFFIVLRGRRSDKAYVLFRDAPLRDVKDALLCPALPNVHGDFQICFAPSAARDSLAEMAEESVGNFWGGRFIRTEILSEAHRQLGLETWSQRSGKDALFGLTHRWIPAKETVASMLKKISAEFTADTVAQKRERSGKDVMSALDTVIAQMAARIESEMKEVCFRLVPSWNIDPTVSAQLGVQFKEAMTELFGVVKSELMKCVDTEISEEALKKALEVAVKHTTDAMNSSADTSKTAALEAFQAALKTKEAK